MSAGEGKKARGECVEEQEKRRAPGRREDEERGRAQEECAEEQNVGGGKDQMYVNNDASNRHMPWWRRAWLIQIDDGPSMHSARGWRPESGEPEERPKRQRERNGARQGENERRDSAVITFRTSTLACNGHSMRIHQ